MRPPRSFSPAPRPRAPDVAPPAAPRSAPSGIATPPGPATPDPATPSPPEAAAPIRGDRLAARRAGRRRRSVAVKVWRLLLPLLMLGIVAGVVGWIWGTAHSHRRPDPPAAGGIHMTSPRFYGRDSRGRAFVLTGTDAVRDARDPHLIAIASPHLDLTRESGALFKVTARRGLYRDDTQKLSLFEDVQVDDGNGGRFYSEAGDVDTVSGDVEGHVRARGEGPMGQVSGDAYTLSGKGDHATFTGAVRSHWINTKGAPAPSAAGGATAKP